MFNTARVEEPTATYRPATMPENHENRSANASSPEELAGYQELHLDNQLCLALQISSSLVTRIYRGLLDPLGLTYPQYLVLIALWERKQRTSMGDLRRLLCMDTGALTPLVKRMEGLGLVQRSRDEADERRVWVDLSEKAWALQDDVVNVRREVVRRLPMSESQIVELRAMLQSMNQAILGS